MVSKITSINKPLLKIWEAYAKHIDAQINDYCWTL